MKVSRYNMFFEYEGETIGFNSFRREFIALDPMLYQMYEASIANKDFSELNEVHPEFYNFLIEKGFLIEDDVNEIEQVKAIVDQIDNDDSVFRLHINPTMNCNFKCWYCYETHIRDSKMDEKTRLTTVLFIKSLFDQKPSIKKFSLSWFGGEPLLYFKKVIHPILEDVSAICTDRNINFKSSMTTNGLLINQDVIDCAKKYNLNFFQITLDGDRNRHNKVRFISEGKGSYDAIVSNIKELAKNRIEVNIRINVSLETLPGMNNIIQDFLDMNEVDRSFVIFDLHKVWQEYNNVSDAALNDARWYYREQGFKVASGSFDTVLESCYADHRNHATINYNGEVFKCTARDFTTANSEGVLSDEGKILWNYKFEKRLNSKFKNKPCLECKIMPLCNGGCSQQAIENEGVDYCVYDFDEDKKKQMVIQKFLEAISVM